MNHILLYSRSLSFSTRFTDHIQSSTTALVLAANSLQTVKEQLQMAPAKFSFCILDMENSGRLQEELSRSLLASEVPTIILSETYQGDLAEDVYSRGLFDYFAKDDIFLLDAVVKAIHRYQKNCNKDILVLEKGSVQNFQISRHLARHGFTVRTAANSQSALHLLKQFTTDLLLVDFGSARLDGIKFLQTVRRLYSRYQLGVMGLFAKDAQHAVGEWLKNGANDFLTQPLRLQELLFRCEQTLESQEQYADLSQLAQLQEHIADSIIEAIITTDENGRVLHCNSAAEIIFGFPVDEVIGKHVADYIAPPSHQEQLKTALNRYTGSETVPNQPKQRIAIPGQHANETILDLEMTISLTRHHDKNRFILFINDVTSKKQLKNALQETLEVAEASNAHIKGFLSNISREIRSPMDAVLGYTDLALTSALTPKTIAYLDKIENSSRSMMGIINNILEYSNIWAGTLKLNLGKFDLHNLFERLADLFSKQVAEKKLELALLIPADHEQVLIGDVVRIEQILINLIRNAIKFTTKGGITVAVKPQKTANQSVILHFTVEDSGMGISPEYL
ncbi:MAG: PAS domain-containing protein, partial [Magnetococcales bacterium]|nr:PAS domain-containing protein [Magnetococcales bacterium]